MKKALFFIAVIMMTMNSFCQDYVKITIIREIGGSATSWVQIDNQDINLNKQDNVKFKTEIEALNYTCKKYDLAVIDFTALKIGEEIYICFKKAGEDIIKKE
jgi:hypothetical protein